MFRLVAPATVDDLKTLMYIESQMKEEYFNGDEEFKKQVHLAYNVGPDDVKKGNLDFLFINYDHLLKDYEFPSHVKIAYSDYDEHEVYVLVHTIIWHDLNPNTAINVVTKTYMIDPSIGDDYYYEYYDKFGQYNFFEVIPVPISIYKFVCCPLYSEFDKDMCLVDLLDLSSDYKEGNRNDIKIYRGDDELILDYYDPVNFPDNDIHMVGNYRVIDWIKYDKLKESPDFCTINNELTDIRDNSACYKLSVFVSVANKYLSFKLNILHQVIHDEWANIVNLIKEDTELGFSLMLYDDLTHDIVIEWPTLKKLLSHYYTKDVISDFENLIYDKIFKFKESGDPTLKTRVMQFEDLDTGESNVLMYHEGSNNKPNQVKSFDVRDYDNFD